MFLMATMVLALARRVIGGGGVALPIDFTITADSINATKFSLVPGVSSADGKTPVAVVTMDATITNQVITRSLPFFGHTVSVTITAGNHGTPVTVTGLTVDTPGLDARNAVFTPLGLSTRSR